MKISTKEARLRETSKGGMAQEGYEKRLEGDY